MSRRTRMAGLAVFTVLGLASFPGCKKSPPQAANPVQPAVAPLPAAPTCQVRVLVRGQSYSRGGSPVVEFALTDLAGQSVGHALTEDSRPVPESETKCDESVRGENNVSIGPQTLELCDPAEQPYVVHITGKDPGLFDLEIRPDADGPAGSPALLCNYAAGEDKKYEWVFRFARKPKPTIFWLGPKDDPTVQQQLKALGAAPK